MPKIPSYDAPNLGLNPTDRGVQGTLNAARRISRTYDEGAAALDRVAGGRRQIASSTERLASETQRLGSETERYGSEAAREGVAFAANLGQGIKDVGDVAVDIAQHREVSHGAATFAEINNNLQTEWNNTAKNADPNDPSVAAKFRESVLEPTLEKFKEGFTTEKGQAWAEAHVDQFRQHMFATTTADMSTLAGEAVATNHKQVVNSLSTLVNSDPSSLTYAIKSLESATAATAESNPNITAAGAGKLKTELLQSGKEAIVKSAAMGFIQKTGQMPGWASDPAYAPYINGAELKTFQQYANAQQRANALTQKQFETYQRQQEAEAAHKTLSQTWTDSVSFDDNGKATIKPDYYKRVMDTEMKFPGAATERARSFINWGQAQQREKREIIITDPKVQSDLYTGLFNPDKPTTDVDILKAANEGKLDAHATSTMLQLSKSLEDAPLKGPVYQGTMAAVKGVLGDSEKGHENYAKFLQTFIPEYLKQQRAGTLPADALDLRNENSLISKSLSPWKLTPQEKMMGTIMKRIGMGGDMGEGFDPAKLLNPNATTPAAPSAPARKIGDVEVPARLGGIAALQYNKARGQWRDQSSGKIYDSAGKEVAP